MHHSMIVSHHISLTDAGNVQSTLSTMSEDDDVALQILRLGGWAIEKIHLQVNKT